MRCFEKYIQRLHNEVITSIFKSLDGTVLSESRELTNTQVLKMKQKQALVDYSFTTC